jgi:prophage regulatory protein
MAEELALLIGKVTELHGRSSEINGRIQCDAQLLMVVQQELSATLSRLWALCKSAPVQPATPSTSPRVLRIVEVSGRIGLCRSSVWRMVSEGQFPPPRRLGHRAVGWLDAEIDEWLKSRDATPAARGLKPRRR